MKFDHKQHPNNWATFNIRFQPFISSNYAFFLPGFKGEILNSYGIQVFCRIWLQATDLIIFFLLSLCKVSSAGVQLFLNLETRRHPREFYKIK